jgi:Tfp pilus assembly pilus retraction ATPase PilT
VTTTIESNVQAIIATWKQLLAWLRDHREDVQTVLVGRDINSILTATATHGAHTQFDGEKIVEAFKSERTEDEMTAYMAMKTMDIRLLEPGVGILRCYMIRSAGRDVLMVRLLDEDPENNADFRLPDSLEALLRGRSGILIVGGPEQSGTTTTFGSLMHRAVDNYPDHLIATIGAPVVHDLQSKHGPVLPINIETRTGVTRYRDAIRQSAKMRARVIGIDDGIREYDAFFEAVTAAERGAIVIATFRAHSAVRALSSLHTNIPPNAREHVWSMFCHNLLGVVALDLVPSRYLGHACPAPDILISSPRLLAPLLAMNTEDLRRYQEDEINGSCLRDAVLTNLVERNEVERNMALRYAVDEESLRSRLGVLR